LGLLEIVKAVNTLEMKTLADEVGPIGLPSVPPTGMEHRDVVHVAETRR
jgi:hypothetical protein